MIYTLGYTGCDPGDLRDLAHLKSTVVIDTRFSPRSRVPAWDGAALKALLGGSYTHDRNLGNRNYKNGRPIEIVNLRRGLEGVKAYLKHDLNVLLLCACSDLKTCHRRVIADALFAALGQPITHLTAASLARLASDIRSPENVQLALWGDNS